MEIYGRRSQVARRQAIKGVARVIEAFAAHGSAFRKHIMILIKDYIHFYAHAYTEEEKTLIVPSLWSLLKVLSESELQVMHTTMIGTEEKAVFQKLYLVYQKEYRYSGKA